MIITAGGPVVADAALTSTAARFQRSPVGAVSLMVIFWPAAGPAVEVYCDQ